METQIDVQEKIMEKKKSANERELERYMKEDREKQIEEELRIRRQERQTQMFHANIFDGKKNLFKDSTAIQGNGSCLRSNVKWL